MNESPAIATTGRLPRPAAIAVRLAFRASAAFCILSALAPDLTAADWPQWRGVRRDGLSYEVGWFTNWPPTEVWRMIIGWGYSSVAVSEGRVYTTGYTVAGGTSNHLYCLDALNGNMIWDRTLSYAGTDGGYGGMRATPTVDGNDVYFLGVDGTLYCCNKITGAGIWSKTVNIGCPGWGFSGSPLVEGNLVIVSAGGAGVAIDKNPPHNLVWSSTTGTAGYSSPVIYTASNSQRIVVFHSANEVVGVNATNGVVVWTYPWSGTWGIPDPIIFGDKMFLTDGYRVGCTVVRLGTGTLSAIWGNSTSLISKTSTPVLMGNYLYGFNYGSPRSQLRCIDANTGQLKWVKTNFGGADALGEGHLMGADDKLIILSSNHLSVVNATHTGYSLLGNGININGSGRCDVQPVLSNGRIYCRQQATLVCYRVGPTKAPDTDADGIGDVWEQKHFTNTANCVAENDNDHDGFSNIQEYAAGTDPTNARSCLSLSITNTGGRLVMGFETVKAEGTSYFTRARFYSIESSTSLTSSAWCPVPECIAVPGTNGPFSCTNTISGPPKFYRMKVTLE